MVIYNIRVTSEILTDCIVLTTCYPQLMSIGGPTCASETLGPPPVNSPNVLHPCTYLNKSEFEKKVVGASAGGRWLRPQANYLKCLTGSLFSPEILILQQQFKWQNRQSRVNNEFVKDTRTSLTAKVTPRGSAPRCRCCRKPSLT